MEGLSAQVLRGFDIKAKKTVKEKAYYICDTSHGLRVIKKSYDTCESIFFQHEIKEHLYSAGFACTDRYYLSNEGKPYFTFDENTYVMTDFIGNCEPNFADPNEFGKIVGQTAILHKLARDIRFTGNVGYGNPDLPSAFKKSLAELISIKKKLSAQTRFSDFDVLFIKNYHYYLRQIKSAIQLLDKTHYTDHCTMAMNNMHICHNALKEENMLFYKNDLYITRFTSAKVDCQIGDLSSIIRRHIKASGGYGLPLWRILDIYDQICPISDEEVNILQPLLQYPHSFMKICRQYYSKKRTWIPNAIINRMESVLAEKDNYERYINL